MGEITISDNTRCEYCDNPISLMIHPVEGSIASCSVCGWCSMLTDDEQTKVRPNAQGKRVSETIRNLNYLHERMHAIAFDTHNVSRVDLGQPASPFSVRREVEDLFDILFEAILRLRMMIDEEDKLVELVPLKFDPQRFAPSKLQPAIDAMDAVLKKQERAEKAIRNELDRYNGSEFL